MSCLIRIIVCAACERAISARSTLDSVSKPEINRQDVRSTATMQHLEALISSASCRLPGCVQGSLAPLVKHLVFCRRSQPSSFLNTSPIPRRSQDGRNVSRMRRYNNNDAQILTRISCCLPSSSARPDFASKVESHTTHEGVQILFICTLRTHGTETATTEAYLGVLL